MLEMEFFGQYFVTEMISFGAMACPFSCPSTNIYFIYNGATRHSLVHVLAIFDIFLEWLQIDHLNGSQLFFNENTLILHLIMQLYLLISYLFILDCNTINSYRYIAIDELIQQVVVIGLHEYHYINIIFGKKWIHNLNGVNSYIMPIIKNQHETKMKKNNTNINNIIKLLHNQLFNILFYYYLIFLRVLVYINLLSIYVAKDAWLNSGSIVIKKNINVQNNTCYRIANTMYYLYNGCNNLFGLLKRNCIDILIIFIGILISNTEAMSCLIIIREYNLMPG